jgi:hypothetical protein
VPPQPDDGAIVATALSASARGGCHGGSDQPEVPAAFSLGPTLSSDPARFWHRHRVLRRQRISWSLKRMEPVSATSVGLIRLIILSNRPSSLESYVEDLAANDDETWLPPPPAAGVEPPQETAPPLNPFEPPSAALGAAARDEPPDE